MEEELYTLKIKKKAINNEKYIENKFSVLLSEPMINPEIIKTNLNKDILDYQKYVKNNRKNYDEINKKIIE